MKFIIVITLLGLLLSLAHCQKEEFVEDSGPAAPPPSSPSSPKNSPGSTDGVILSKCFTSFVCVQNVQYPQTNQTNPNVLIAHTHTQQVRVRYHGNAGVPSPFGLPPAVAFGNPFLSPGAFGSTTSSFSSNPFGSSFPNPFQSAPRHSPAILVPAAQSVRIWRLVPSPPMTLSPSNQTSSFTSAALPSNAFSEILEC